MQDYEALSLTDMLRIPVLQQQFRLDDKFNKQNPERLPIPDCFQEAQCHLRQPVVAILVKQGMGRDSRGR